MHKPSYKDCTNPPGQIVNPVGHTEKELLAMSALSTPKAKTLSDVIDNTKRLGDIIDKVWRNDKPSPNAQEEAFRNGRAEGYTQGYYDGVIAERHKWLTQTYHQESKDAN